MIIVWGFRARSKEKGQGQFHCPHCQADRYYSHRDLRKWFTLFWIPLIPLNRIMSYVRCTECSGEFDESVLTQPTTAQTSESLASGRRVLIARAVAASGNSGAARHAAVNEMHALRNTSYSLDQLDVDMNGSSDGDLNEWMDLLSNHLSTEGRENVIYSAARVAAADGPLDANERALLSASGGRLGLTPIHLDGVLKQAEIDVGVPGGAGMPNPAAESHPGGAEAGDHNSER